MDDVVLEARSLTRRFDPVIAVNNLSLQVRKGEIFGLVGPDGAGKTTTLRLLCGLIEPHSGQALVAGLDPAANRDAVIRRIGYMGQRFGLYTDLTIDENLKFYADLFEVPQAIRDDLQPKLLQMTRLEPFRDRQAGKLSGGMKQKLALICTLLRRPDILLLDEPTNGVDPVSRREFWTILYDLVKDGVTVLVTTAYLDEAERCNRVGLMHRGRLIQCDAPDVLCSTVRWTCLEVRSTTAHRALRPELLKATGVHSAEPAGETLHLFFDPARTTQEKLRSEFPQVEFREITPSLEDVFIALVRDEAVVQ